MSNEERKIYDLVVRRFISVLYPAFEYEQTTMRASAAGQNFAARGKIILSPGWKTIYDADYDVYTDEDGYDDMGDAGSGLDRKSVV